MIWDGKKIDVHIAIAKAWFTLLGYSLLIGTVKFIGDKTDNLIIQGIFWISWYLFFQNVRATLELMNYDVLPKRFKKYQYKFNVSVNSLLELIVVSAMFLIIWNTVETFK